MKQMKELRMEEEEKARAQIIFDKRLAEWKEKYKDFLTEDVIKHFSMKYRMDREEAILKLCANFSKEENSVDSKTIALNAMKGVRMVSPKVIGLEQRQNDMLFRVKALEQSVLAMSLEIKEQKKVKEDLISWIESLIGSAGKTNENLKELTEEKPGPLIHNESLEKTGKIKESWISSRLKTFLQKN